MDLVLIRKAAGYRSDGIFSRLFKGIDGEQVAETIEHAYPSVSADVVVSRPLYPAYFDWLPKLPPGVFVCVRGKHRLHGMVTDFETFEITGVQGHDGLLFHWGNFNRDSRGCVCVGERQVLGTEDYDKIDGPDFMVTNSKATFVRFMDLQDGVDQFNLRVEA